MKPSRAGARVLVKVGVSSGLLIFLFTKISIGGLVELVRTIETKTMAAAMAVFFVSNLLGSFQWHLLLRSSGVPVAFSQSFRFYFVGLFFNNFLPANIGGDAVKIYDVTRIGGSVYQVIAVTVLDRLIGIFSLCLLAAAAVLYLMADSAYGSLALYLVIFVACMIPPVVFYFFGRPRRILRSLVSFMRPLSMDKRGASILDHMGEFKSRRWFVSRLVSMSLVIQFLRVLTHVLVAVALGIRIQGVVFGLFYVFVPLLSLAMIPPITINGLGVREGLGIVLFSEAGIGQTGAFALEFLTYLVSVSISLFGLLFFLARRGAEVGSRTDSSAI